MNESNLHYPIKDYVGRVFWLSLDCIYNADLQCAVFKLKGDINYYQGKMYKT